MASRSLDVLEDRADDAGLAVRDAVDVELDRVGEELVDEDGAAFRDLDRLLDVFPEPVLVVDDRHAASAEDEARAHEDGIADLTGDLQGVVDGVGDSARRLLHAHLVDEGAEEVAVLGERDVVGRRSEDVHACLGETLGEVERGLAAELNDRAVAPLALVDLHHVLEG